ncbi:MAG: PhoU domain-containing protein [Thermodesulfobacteriota bacterium]
MRFPAGLEENLRFLVLEVHKQIEETLNFIASPSQRLLEHINGRDDYIDNMKSLIEERSFAFLTGTLSDRHTSNLLRSINTIASNLERIADFAVNIVNQMQFLTDSGFLARYDYQTYFEEVFAGLETTMDAIIRQDLAQAFRICQCEFHLDGLYKADLDHILEELKQGRETGNLITALFIFRYLERMGDSLLNIGEAIIFAIIGEKLKIHQYQALRDTLAASGLEAPMSEVEFASIWGTRSGCRIGTVQEQSEDGRAQRVIFKEGVIGKIQREKDNIERWQALMPGLPPRVFGFQAAENNASLLLEYLGGCTFQEVLVNSDKEILENALFLIVETTNAIWRATRKDQTVNADFVNQLRARIEDVYRVHPRFERADTGIGNLRVLSLGGLIQVAAEVAAALPAPFSVFIHGDFNVNNIIYHHTEQRVHFIDLYRSADSDYVQDVSVFLVSNFRLPVARSHLRDRISYVVLEFLRFARVFARESDDACFEARLALGLVRSFFTSTRFELNAEFAKAMYLRSVYLMEKLRDHRGRPWPEFRLPDSVLVY